MDLPLYDTDLKFFQVNEREYVLDIPTSSLFEIHPGLRRILEMSVQNEDLTYLENLKREYHFGDWTDMESQLREMIDSRNLTIYASKIAPYELKEQKINSICLNISHDCNLNCRYCYQSGGTYAKPAEYMSRDVALKAIEFLSKESPDKTIYITISGGEPLLNVDLVKYIVRTGQEYAEKYEKELAVTLATNGTLLDKDLLRYLANEDVELVVSLDGVTEETNQLRQMANCSSSLDLVLERLKMVKESKIAYRIKGILHHLNIPMFNTLLENFFKENYPVIDLQPVIAKPETEYALNQEDIDRLKFHIRQLFQYYRNNDPFVLRLAILTSAVKCIADQHNAGYTCGAGKNYLAITPNGDIYPCHLLIDHAEFRLGNILDGTLNQDLRKKFYQPLHVLNRESCRSCWARYFCGGGCVGENYLMHENLTIPAEARCQLVRYCMEQAVQVYCSLLTEGEKLDFNPERRKSGREIYKIS